MKWAAIFFLLMAPMGAYADRTACAQSVECLTKCMIHVKAMEDQGFKNHMLNDLYDIRDYICRHGENMSADTLRLVEWQLRGFDKILANEDDCTLNSDIRKALAESIEAIKRIKD